MDSSALLATWERGAGQAPVQRGLALLALAWPERSADEWASASIGERDAYLLRLREQLFGEQLEGVADCPQCAEPLELAFATGDIRVPGKSANEEIVVEEGEYRLACRLPNSLDLLASTGDALTRRAELIGRCVVSACRGGLVTDERALPEPVVEAVAKRLAEADPQAAVDLALTCPGCGHRWLMPFDILSYLWTELEDWAHRLILDVHALASSYGWSERDIFAMSPRRRRMYLELLGV